MSKTILILFSLIISIYSNSQLSSDSLFQFEKDILNEINPQKKSLLVLKKFNYLLSNDKIDTNTYTLTNRIDFNYIGNEQETNRYLWNAALINFYFSDFRTASYYHEKYCEKSKDTNSIESNLLGLIVNKENMSLQKSFLSKLQTLDTVFNTLNCFEKLNLTDTVIKQKYIRLARIFPGLGLIKMGEIKRGVVSMVATLTFTTATALLAVNKLYFNAVEVFYVFAFRFYQGSIVLTNKQLIERENEAKKELAKNCELKLNLILKKYKIQLIR